MDNFLPPEEGPAPPEEPPMEQEEEIPPEPPPRQIDPGLMYLALMAIAVVGLTRLAPDVRYTLLWSVLAIFAVITIFVDRLTFEPIALREIQAGIGIGLLVGLPLLGVGAAQLRRVSLDIFGRGSDAAVFQLLVFTMPLAETLFFRGALHAARGTVFTALAAGVWSIALFFPQLDVLGFPLVALVIGSAFLFTGILYAYMRQRFGFYASWICQITLNIVLLFAARFV